MHESLLFGSSVTAAVIAGFVALLAPCCVSVMLPAYFASAFHNRRLLVAMTFVFGIGVATVILPLALGATALRRAIFGQHHAVYLVGAALLVGLGIYTLGGGRLRLPQPGGSASSRTGVRGVYSLGLFSGVATACCAPVLAGVVALSGAASSFVTSLGLGLAYVFGMVGPLFVAALAWERFGDRVATFFRPRTVTYKIGSLERTITRAALASGILLLSMGGLSLWIGFQPAAMDDTGWRAAATARFDHYGHVVTRALQWAPGWLMLVVLVAAAIVLARQARHELRGESPPSDDSVDGTIIEEQHGNEYNEAQDATEQRAIATINEAAAGATLEGRTGRHP